MDDKLINAIASMISEWGVVQFSEHGFTRPHPYDNLEAEQLAQVIILMVRDDVS